MVEKTIKNFFNDIKVGIVGYGFVGQATHKGILQGKTVTIHDIARDTSLDDLVAADIVFFCIPTDDWQDVDTLMSEIQQLKIINPGCKIVIRCTVPIGTCSRIEQIIQDKILYMPEFLRQRYWQTDCMKRPLIVGHSGVKINEWLGDEDVMSCSLHEAELTKMFNNNIGAMKVVFANHFYDLAQRSCSDYDRVVSMFETVQHDQNYLEVNENLRAFGGKCLPKDLDFMIDTMEAHGLPQTMFDAIKKDNKKWKVTVTES